MRNVIHRTEYFCDLCKAQVESERDLKQLYMKDRHENQYHGTSYSSVDICRECRELPISMVIAALE